MDGWLRAPLTLKGYVGVSLGWGLVGFAFNPQALGVPLFIVTVVICFFLLRGSEGLWWIVLAFSIIALATDPITPGMTWYLIAGQVVLLVLLVAPETRRYCGVGRQPSL